MLIGENKMPHTTNRKEWIVLDTLCDFILNNVDGYIVDLGVGMSTLVLADYAIKHNRIQYTVDRRQDRLEFYCKAGLHDKHVLLNKGKSYRHWPFFDSLNDSPAIVFMDHTHHYWVKQEIYYFLKKMASGAVLFLHDTYPDINMHRPPLKVFACERIRRELEQDKSLWVYTWVYANQAENYGLSMITKKGAYERKS